MTNSFFVCPRCGSHMVNRKRKRDGRPFLGCTSFPKCRGTRPIEQEVSGFVPFTEVNIEIAVSAAMRRGWSKDEIKFVVVSERQFTAMKNSLAFEVDGCTKALDKKKFVAYAQNSKVRTTNDEVIILIYKNSKREFWWNRAKDKPEFNVGDEVIMQADGPYKGKTACITRILGRRELDWDCEIEVFEKYYETVLSSFKNLEHQVEKTSMVDEVETSLDNHQLEITRNGDNYEIEEKEMSDNKELRPMTEEHFKAAIEESGWKAGGVTIFVSEDRYNWLQKENKGSIPTMLSSNLFTGLLAAEDMTIDPNCIVIRNRNNERCFYWALPPSSPEAYVDCGSIYGKRRKFDVPSEPGKPKESKKRYETTCVLTLMFKDGTELEVKPPPESEGYKKHGTKSSFWPHVYVTCIDKKYLEAKSVNIRKITFPIKHELGQATTNENGIVGRILGDPAQVLCCTEYRREIQKPTQPVKEHYEGLEALKEVDKSEGPIGKWPGNKFALEEGE